MTEQHRDFDQRESDDRNVAEGLYHEAQADGVPYDEDLEPRAKDLPKLDAPAS